MTEVTPKVKKLEAKKSDETLLNDAKERIMRLQKKTKKNSSTDTKAKGKTFKKTKKNSNKRGVVYLGHLPHGFYEEELRGFFSQFGKVSRVKVSRSPKTGKSKGYAFIEFAFNDVAKIVAETMNNYLMFERLVKAQYIPPEKVHSKMFPAHFMTPETYPTLLRRNRVMAKQEKPSTEEDKKKNRSRIQFKIDRAVSALKEFGIDHHPQIYDPEAGRDGEISLTNDDEVPQLVEIQTTITENNQSKKMQKGLKKDKTNAEVKPVTDSKPKKTTKVTADAVSVAVQPTTPERTSPKTTRNQRKATLQKNDKAIQAKPTPDTTPAALIETDKVIKLQQKVSVKKEGANITQESPKGKRKSLAVTEINPTANVAVLQTPSKRSKSTIKSPTKASDTPSKKDLAKSSPQSTKTNEKKRSKSTIKSPAKASDTPSKKDLAKFSPQPAKTNGKTKSKTLEKVAAPSKLPVRSVKGKKPV